jgi:hypothetical protein
MGITPVPTLRSPVLIPWHMIICRVPPGQSRGNTQTYGNSLEACSTIHIELPLLPSGCAQRDNKPPCVFACDAAQPERFPAERHADIPCAARSASLRVRRIFCWFFCLFLNLMPVSPLFFFMLECFWVYVAWSYFTNNFQPFTSK